MDSITTAMQSLRAAMPADVRARWDEEDRQRAKLSEDLRIACSDVLADLACAIRHPRIARTDLESAYRAFMRALSIASVLDPEEN